MHITRRVITVFAIMFLTVPAVSATDYKIDAHHSSVGFRVRHLISYTKGSFGEFEGNFVYTPGSADEWAVSAVIQSASIDTNVENRDKHLRSKDFLDVEQYPQISFRSTNITDVTETTAKLHGLLAMHGVEQEVVLDLEIHGEGTDPWGNNRSGFSAATKINRKDFGINWNETLDNGGLLLGEEVEIILEIEGIAKQ